MPSAFTPFSTQQTTTATPTNSNSSSNTSSAMSTPHSTKSNRSVSSSASSMGSGSSSTVVKASVVATTKPEAQQQHVREPGSPGSPAGTSRRRNNNMGVAPPGMDLVVGEELDKMLSDGKTGGGVSVGGGGAEQLDFTTTSASAATGDQQRGRKITPVSNRSQDDASIGLSPHGLAPHGLPEYDPGQHTQLQQASASPGSNFPVNPQRVPSPPTPSKKAKSISGAARKLQSAKNTAADAQTQMLNQQNDGVNDFVVSTGPIDSGYTSSTEDSFTASGASSSFTNSLGLRPSGSHRRPGFRVIKCFKPPAASPKHIPLLKRLSGVDAATAYANTPEGREALRKKAASPQMGQVPPSVSDASGGGGGSLHVGFIAPGVYKREQKVAVALVDRMKRRDWLEFLETESTMNRNCHRVGLHMMASEAYRWNRLRQEKNLPFVPMPKQFMRGLRHDFNLLLGPTQEKDRYHAALQATIALRMWHPPAPPVPRPSLVVGAQQQQQQQQRVNPMLSGRRSHSVGSDASSSSSRGRSNSNGGRGGGGGNVVSHRRTARN